MKKLVLMSVLFVVLAVPAKGVMTATLYNESPGMGGPYRVVLGGDLSGTFQTFCVEGGSGGIYEAFYTSRMYYITIDDIVMYSGGPEDTLREPTKKLYAAFLNGGAVTQEMIWDSENYDAYADFDFVANGFNIDGFGNVKVMNLWDKSGGLGGIGNPMYAAQSQLILVPAPGALLLGSIGMALVGWLRRRHHV